jgi:hypothetical protein
LAGEEIGVGEIVFGSHDYSYRFDHCRRKGPGLPSEAVKGR